MSTFKGIVAEFPEIRSKYSIKCYLDTKSWLIYDTVDFFRKSSEHPPPLACFLSHVHSDHLAGLDTLKSPL